MLETSDFDDCVRYSEWSLTSAFLGFNFLLYYPQIFMSEPESINLWTQQLSGDDKEKAFVSEPKNHYFHFISTNDPLRES